LVLRAILQGGTCFHRSLAGSMRAQLSKTRPLPLPTMMPMLQPAPLNANLQDPHTENIDLQDDTPLNANLQDPHTENIDLQDEPMNCQYEHGSTNAKFVLPSRPSPRA
jgi:hypothetical protein